MKAKVIVRFVDKETRRLINAGTEIDFEDSRIEALVKKGYVVKLKKPATKTVDVKKPRGGA